MPSSYLPGVLHKLLPLALEFFSAGDVDLPVLVVLGDEELALGELWQDGLHDDDGATGVQALVASL